MAATLHPVRKRCRLPHLHACDHTPLRARLQFITSGLEALQQAARSLPPAVLRARLDVLADGIRWGGHTGLLAHAAPRMPCALCTWQARKGTHEAKTGA